MAKTLPIDFESFFNTVNGDQRGSTNTVYGIDPSTENRLWNVPVATKEDIEDAVTAANSVFRSWRETPIVQRIKLIGNSKMLTALF